MKAIVYTKYGSPDVLQIPEVDKPAPGDHELLKKTGVEKNRGQITKKTGVRSQLSLISVKTVI